MARKKKKPRKKAKFAQSLSEMGYRNYAAYLRSDHWKQFRVAYWKTRRKLCWCCGQPATELHHTHYECLGKEKAADVKPVCRECHQSIHDIIKRCRVHLAEGHKVVKRVLAPKKKPPCKNPAT